MATKLFLRSTQTNGIGPTYFDMLVVAGSGTVTAATTTTASGTEIQWTQTGGGAELLFISGRAPPGGFTLTTTDLSIWAHESGTGVNAGGGYRLFKRAADGTETELGGGLYEDGVEFTKTTPTEMAWAGNPTDTAFAENDRILLKIKAVDVGTMGAGTVTLTYNGADAATGDSFLNIAETVTFKAEEVMPGNYFRQFDTPSWSRWRAVAAVAAIASGCVYVGDSSVIPVAAGSSSAGPTFEHRLLYQAKTQPTFVPVAETITLDKWFAPLADPVRVPRPAASLWATTADLLPRVAANWQSALSEPTRRLPTVPWQRFETFDPLPRVASNWQQPLSEPTRCRPAVVWQQPDMPDPLPRVASNWQQPLAQPTRIAPSPLAGPVFVFAPTEAETVTLDKWWAAWSGPAARKAEAQTAGGVFVSVVVSAEVITPDKWFIALPEPYLVRLYPAAFQIAALIDPAPAAAAADTHDGGDAIKRRRDPNARQPWNKQPFPTLAQLRKLLGLDRRETPAAIEDKAETIEDVAEAVAGDAPPPAAWAPPAEIGVNPEIPRLLALLQRDLEQTRIALDRAQNAARREAIARYEKSVLELRAAIKARQDEDEEDELITLIAARIIN